MSTTFICFMYRDERALEIHVRFDFWFLYCIILIYMYKSYSPLSNRVAGVAMGVKPPISILLLKQFPLSTNLQNMYEK